MTAHVPADVAALVATLTSEAPRLLAGFDPDRVGVVLVHPQSCAALPDLAARDRVLLTIEPLDELRQLAARLDLRLARRPGWFAVLLVGVETSAMTYCAPPERADFERRAS